MIPLKDNIPHVRKPYITVTILLVNVAIFIGQIMLGRDVERLIYVFGFIPASLFSDISLGAKAIPLFSSMFLHGSLLHLLGNMLFLWVFADNVEDRLGHLRFLFFYLVCGVSAALIHTMFNLGSQIPTIGASGAIAGVLGAYFMLYPRAKIMTLVPIFIFFTVIEIPAFYFLGFWFLFQFILGLFSLGFDCCGGIALWAHIGGFLAGIMFLFLFLPRRRRQRI